MEFQGRVAVVTGASSGLSRATAVALAGAGWRIIALGRNWQRSAEAEEAIRATGGGASVHMIVAHLALMAEVRRAAGKRAHYQYVIRCQRNDRWPAMG